MRDGKDKSHSKIVTEKKGRLELSATCCLVGAEMLVMLTGGSAHIGAFAVANPSGEVESWERSGHRDGSVAVLMATRMACALKRTVGVCAGIHYDDISKSEIAEILAMSEILADRLVTWQQTGGD